MGQNTKIDWCDATWNPVTGCLHGCEYCYARRIAERFSTEQKYKRPYEPVLPVPTRRVRTKPEPYPYGFKPTFHRYKLDEPKHWKKPRNIFVCSMADLFGDWVPDAWIQDVFEACAKAPQHRYFFLTKAPERYNTLDYLRPLFDDYRDIFWFGTTITSEQDSYGIYSLLDFQRDNGINTFVSVEPLRAPLWWNARNRIAETQWVIIGAETGGHKNRVVPEREWVENIVNTCIQHKTPVFMKESLRGLMGDDFKQEFPWEV